MPHLATSSWKFYLNKRDEWLQAAVAYLAMIDAYVNQGCQTMRRENIPWAFRLQENMKM
jgi:hypothetical protein